MLTYPHASLICIAHRHYEAVGSHTKPVFPIQQLKESLATLYNIVHNLREMFGK